jgi:uncharacterized membrane protein HdeD (DUF308 family)
MWRIYGGAIMVIAGIAAFTEAHTHRPGRIERGWEQPPSELSTTAYDILRIGAWALLILGAVTLIVGLIRYWQRPRRAA